MAVILLMVVIAMVMTMMVSIHGADSFENDGADSFNNFDNNVAGSISRGAKSADGDGGSKLVVTLLLSFIQWNELFDTGYVSGDSKYADDDAFPFSISSLQSLIIFLRRGGKYSGQSQSFDDGNDDDDDDAKDYNISNNTVFLDSASIDADNDTNIIGWTLTGADDDSGDLPMMMLVATTPETELMVVSLVVYSNLRVLLLLCRCWCQW